ncbi:MAG: L-seryl-tRNA(Sec) selenium transferase [Actinomycetota bacterium]|nr:L-seryl-tRNA(Sec) selenium transferase [Actinomycetota bacterium]
MDKKDYLRRLSSVNDLMQAVYRGHKLGGGIPRDLVTEASRTVLDGVREAILAAKDELSLEEIDTDTDQLVSLVEKEVEERIQFSFRRVINATGVVVHTNLGRSLLSRSSLEALTTAGSSYNNLEFRLEDGSRGSRQVHVKELLRDLTGAESALVVNNNAAGVLLALTTHATGKEVIVSRGQLIEIGGSFRLPDVMAQSGARLVEVGTTNKTYLEDYRKAITSETAMILRAHSSNYRIMGFTSEVAIKELAEMAHEYELVLLDDLGSGAYLDMTQYGLAHEPTISQSLDEGADIVCFSGDKLLGGPQGGMVLGKAELVDAMSRHPLARALRVGKLTLAAMEATLRHYMDLEEAVAEIPTLSMLTTDPDILKKRARHLAKKIAPEGSSFSAEVISETSRAGGGALPMADLPTWVVAVTSSRHKTSALEEMLRMGEPPLICRVKDDRILLDMRTVSDEELTEIVETFSAIEGAEDPDRGS